MMRRVQVILVALLAPLLLAQPLRAADPAPLSPAEKESLRLAMQRGRLLYAYDRAAWYGTDDMLAKLRDATARVGGWLVDGPADSPHLIFFDKDPAQPHIIYAADFRGGKIVGGHVLGESEDRSLSESRKALVGAIGAARQAMIEARPMRCVDKPFNTVTLPPASPGDPFLVYFLTPQTRNDSWPMGGHYIVEVSADGKASAPRPFTRSCLEMSLPKESKGKAEALVISHLLGPVPTEIHVFSSFAARLPVMVLTIENKRAWGVNRTAVMELPFPKE